MNMKNEKDMSRRQEHPEMKEQTFGGALFGFKRSDVLEYVRNLSDENEKYVHSLGNSIDQLQQSLQASQEESEKLREQITRLNGALQESNDQAVANLEQKEAIRAELQLCQNQLAAREENCVQLQQAHDALKTENDEISAQIANARQLVAQTEEKLAAETARHTAREDELKKLYLQKLKETIDNAREEREKQERENALHEEALKKENDEKLHSLHEDADSILHQLEEKSQEQQLRIVRSVEKVDADLIQIRQEMETLQQQLADARGRIQQTAKQLDELLVDTPFSAQQVGGQKTSRITVTEETAGPERPQTRTETANADRRQQTRSVEKEPEKAKNTAKEHKTVSSVRVQTTVQTPKFTTVRSARTSVADHLLDALGRMWDKK